MLTALLAGLGLGGQFLGGMGKSRLAQQQFEEKKSVMDLQKQLLKTQGEAQKIALEDKKLKQSILQVLLPYFQQQTGENGEISAKGEQPEFSQLVDEMSKITAPWPETGYQTPEVPQPRQAGTTGDISQLLTDPKFLLLSKMGGMDLTSVGRMMQGQQTAGQIIQRSDALGNVHQFRNNPITGEETYLGVRSYAPLQSVTQQRAGETFQTFVNPRQLTGQPFMTKERPAMPAAQTEKLSEARIYSETMNEIKTMIKNKKIDTGLLAPIKEQLDKWGVLSDRDRIKLRALVARLPGLMYAMRGKQLSDKELEVALKMMPAMEHNEVMFEIELHAFDNYVSEAMRTKAEALEELYRVPGVLKGTNPSLNLGKPQRRRFTREGVEIQ